MKVQKELAMDILVWRIPHQFWNETSSRTQSASRARPWSVGFDGKRCFLQCLSIFHMSHRISHMLHMFQQDFKWLLWQTKNMNWMSEPRASVYLPSWKRQAEPCQSQKKIARHRCIFLTSKKWGATMLFWSSSTNLWFNNLASGGCCKSCTSLAHPYCCFMHFYASESSEILSFCSWATPKQSSCIIFESLFLRSTESSLITVTAVKFIHCVISFEVKTYSRFWKAILPKSWSQWNLLPSFHDLKSPGMFFCCMFSHVLRKNRILGFLRGKGHHIWRTIRQLSLARWESNTLAIRI